jgi:glycosyltransferase involved in cell wall biosynthesis
MLDNVTVVVPAYNAERFIGQGLKSILSQTLPVAEVLVVDDGSTDGTAGVVSRFGGPVRLLHQPNAGVSTARNRGLQEAAGRFVAFCDADDLWLPSKLEKQMEALTANPSASGALSGAMEVDADLEARGAVPCPTLHEVTWRDLLWHKRGEIPPGVSSTLLAGKKFLDEAGGWDPLLSDAADWDLALRLRRLGPFVGPRDPLIWYRVYAGSMSSRARLRASDAQRLFGKLMTSAAPGELSEIRAAWGRHAVVMAASLARSEGFSSAVPWLLGEVARHPWPVGKACLARMVGK